LELQEFLDAGLFLKVFSYFNEFLGEDGLNRLDYF
jgi:hypothetical protein